MIGQELFYTGNKQKQPVKVVSEGQVCSHEDPVSGGHFRRDKTYQKVAKRYRWSGKKNDIAEYVSKCLGASASPTGSHQRRLPYIQWLFLYVVGGPVGTDLVGSLPETGRGHKYIGGLSDYFSRWPIAVPLKTKSASKVANVLIGVICSYGCFERELFKKFM